MGLSLAGAVPAPSTQPTNSAVEPPWYLAYTKPRQEAFALQKLQEQGYQAYLATLTRWARKRDGWHTTETAMFPRYLFVRPGRAQQGVSPIASTPGVSNLVRFGHILALLSADRLVALQAVTASMASDVPDHPFDVGAKVAFTAGPLKGANGIVSSVARERVSVLMTLLGQQHTVSVPAAALAMC